jgi:hypothetical protein
MADREIGACLVSAAETVGWDELIVALGHNQMRAVYPAKAYPT